MSLRRRPPLPTVPAVPPRSHPVNANVCDFAQSFVTFRIDLLKKQPRTVSQPPPFTLNNARLQLECRCRVTPPEAASAVEYVLSAACKAEQVNVKEDIWHQPAADMCIAASADEF